MEMNRKSLALAIVASFALSACGGSSGGGSSTPTTPTPTNAAPTDITLSNMSVDENATAAVIGTLTATDSDSGDTFTFTTDSEEFSIDGDQLSLAQEMSANYEDATSYTVNVTVTDNGGLSFSKELTVDVNDLLDTYTFDSKLISDASSVSYSGQVARHVLIAELNHYIGNTLKGELEDGTLLTRDDVINKLNKYFRTTEEQYDDFPITFIDDAEQGFITDVSGTLKNLKDKLAGNDSGGQHKQWNDGDFAGWGAKGSVTPTELVDVLFGQLADNAQAHLDGIVRQAVTGESITDIYVNTDGTDLKQLIQKFLLGGITYSQATDDYLGHETTGKGLTTDNISEAKAGTSYSNLEHQFDEGFGYFGAARNYLEYNDYEIASKVSSPLDGRVDWNGKHDTNGDGVIDLKSEYNFGNSVNAAKRDLNTAGRTAPTDYTKDAMTAFLQGRKIINDNVGMALSEEQMTELKAQRDIAVDAWERAIASTVVHYINDTIDDLDNLGTDSFSYTDLAKHWSEMKGFALGLQFNPYSKITDEQFEEIHVLMAGMPVLDTTAVDAYKLDLLAARDIIEAALSFDNENVTNW